MQGPGSKPQALHTEYATKDADWGEAYHGDLVFYLVRADNNDVKDKDFDSDIGDVDDMMSALQAENLDEHMQASTKWYVDRLCGVSTASRPTCNKGGFYLNIVRQLLQSIMTTDS